MHYLGINNVTIKIRKERMLTMSRDNFKDDFENRQSIDSNDQFDRVNNETNDEIDNFNNETDQQFPPRNAQRRQRRRNQSSSRNKNLTIRLMIMKKVH